MWETKPQANHTHINTVLEVDVWVSRKLYSNVTIDANGFTPGYGNQRLNRPLRKLNPQGESQRSEWGREEHSTRDSPNRRMTKHRAEENMTSAHSAKETEKWQWGSVRNFGMNESVYPTQPRTTMETPSRKLQTNRLPRPLSNCQVSMTPESQSKERAEPQSGKQKTQY